MHAVPCHPVWRFGVEVTDDGQYLIITTHKGTDPVNRLYYAHLPRVWASWREAAAAAAASRASDEPPPHLAPGGTPPSPDSYAYLPLVRLINSFAADFNVIANDGARFYLQTNWEAPRYRVVAMDLPPEAPHASATVAGDADDADAPLPRCADALPQHATDVLDWATVAAGRSLLACFMHDVANELRLYALPEAAAPPRPLEGGACLLEGPSTVPLPSVGTIAAYSGRREQSAAHVKFVSFLTPGTTLRLEFGARSEARSPPGTFAADVPHPSPGASAPAARLTTLYQTRLPGFEAAEFEASREMVASTDGSVQLPLFIVRKKAAAGAAAAAGPTLLYGYGGFNVSLQPSFSALRLCWLAECGGTFALACVRGGGEYGEEWHAAGQRLSKQNVFDDFHACAANLRASGVARSLGIMGGSNGGLLTLVCAAQRPVLYDACISQVPVADMLRFHRFTVGALWRGEYGFAETDAADFACMRAYSRALLGGRGWWGAGCGVPCAPAVTHFLTPSPPNPLAALHNVVAPASAAAQLPATLITTADHDDRVSPLHSFKMAAELQATAGASEHQTRPLLIRIESQAGHGAGKPTAKVLDEMSDVYAFLALHLDATFVAKQ